MAGVLYAVDHIRGLLLTFPGLLPRKRAWSC
jgi:hypothetical protein